MIYPTPIIIPVSRGHHSIPIGSVPLLIKIIISSMVISLMLFMGLMWWEMKEEFDSKLEQLFFTIPFLFLEIGLTCLLVGLF